MLGLEFGVAPLRLTEDGPEAHVRQRTVSTKGRLSSGTGIECSHNCASTSSQRVEKVLNNRHAA